jgi:hypothetical protein
MFSECHISDHKPLVEANVLLPSSYWIIYYVYHSLLSKWVMAVGESVKVVGASFPIHLPIHKVPYDHTRLSLKELNALSHYHLSRKFFSHCQNSLLVTRHKGLGVSLSCRALCEKCAVFCLSKRDLKQEVGFAWSME